ncbi:unnamed protein product [Urochloa humidicola]
MDFHALSRRELQALCKRNAVRANMSNAAMADALRSLPSVDGLDEIGRTAPPVSAMKSVEEVIVEEEKTDGRPAPGGGRAGSKGRTAAADKVEQDAPDQAVLQGNQGTAVRESVAPVEMEEVIGEKQGHGCPLPRGGRTRAKTRKAEVHKTEEEVLAPDTLQENQRAAAGEGMAPVEAEKVATGKGRTRRSTRSKVKMALDKEEVVAVAVQKEEKADTSDAAFGSLLVVSDKSCNDPKEDEVVAVVEDDATKPEEGQNVTRRPAAHEAEEEVPVPAILRRSQRTVAPVGMAPVEAEDVATGKRRTRRSVKSRVKMALVQTEAEEATVWKEPKDSSDVTIGFAVVSDKSCDGPKMHEVVVVVEEEVTKGQNMARRSQRTAAPVEVGEVATAKKRTRRSTRSKVPVATQKGQKADSSDATIGSADKSSDPKEDEVVAVVEEETTNADKMEESQVPDTLQQSQMTTAPQASTSKRRRRPRIKVAAAARNGQKAESSDAATGSPVSVLDQSCDALREDQLVVMVEEHVTESQEVIVEEEEQSITSHKSASSVKMQNPPTVSVLSKPEATDIPDKSVAAVEETVKKDPFTLTAKVDQSDLLVNTLDRFSKPVYEFTVKEEKKQSECWWMLM